MEPCWNSLLCSRLFQGGTPRRCFPTPRDVSPHPGMMFPQTRGNVPHTPGRSFPTSVVCFICGMVFGSYGIMERANFFVSAFFQEILSRSMYSLLSYCMRFIVHHQQNLSDLAKNPESWFKPSNLGFMILSWFFCFNIIDFQLILKGNSIA